MHTFEAHCSCPVPQLRQVLSVVLGDPDGLWDPDGYWQMWQMYNGNIGKGTHCERPAPVGLRALLR